MEYESINRSLTLGTHEQWSPVADNVTISKGPSVQMIYIIIIFAHVTRKRGKRTGLKSSADKPDWIQILHQKKDELGSSFEPYHY